MSLEIQRTPSRSDLDRNTVLHYLRNGCYESVNRYNWRVPSNNYRSSDISRTSVCRVESTLILSCEQPFKRCSIDSASWENRQSRLLMQTSEILLYFTLKRLYNTVIRWYDLYVDPIGVIYWTNLIKNVRSTAKETLRDHVSENYT